ncbi:MAG: flippase-like domain-containing protein [FCB group bacterium]|nr:flippase-like domain-containing protein [FCB group bacterium]
MNGKTLGSTGVKWAVRIALLLLIAVAVIILKQNGEEWAGQFREYSWEIDWLLLVLSAVILAVSFFMTPFGWQWLAHSAGCEARSSELRGVWFASQLGRYVPGKIWLFAGRAAYLKTTGLSVVRSATVPFVEVIFTAASAGLITLLTAIFIPGFADGNETVRLALIVSGVCFLIIPVFSPLQRLLYKIKHGMTPTKLPLPSFSLSLKLMTFYVFLWITRGIVLYLWLKGLGILPIDFGACIGAAPFSWLAGYIVFFVPGGLGVREAATVAVIATVETTGPVLVALFAIRILLTSYEVIMALVSAKTTGLVGKRKGTTE